MTPGQFVISLDMELMWGVRDKTTKEKYGHRVLGERVAIPAMLDLFGREDIHASWAVVGFAMCDGIDELLARAPALQPTYLDRSRSAYSYLGEAGASERADPYYFAPSLVREICGVPHQEVCTHTFSHYYCLEPGQTLEQFSADLGVVRQQMCDWKLPCKSIVFPRNQYTPAHVAECADNGITVYRGNENSWFYRSVAGDEQTRLRRLGRLIDTYLPLAGNHNARPVRQEGAVDVPSSRLLRAYNPKLRRLEPLRLARVKSAMTAAAVSGEAFHLWWHPHNFGADTAENINFLSQVLAHFRHLADRYGMRSATMSEAAAAA